MFKNENNQTRREFLSTLGNVLAGVTIVGFVAPIINSCSSPTDPGAGVAAFNITVDVSSLTVDGTALRTLTPDGHDLLVVRQSATTYITLLLICTHQQCTGNNMSVSSSTINCSCHGSQFDLAGNVKRGPASSSLKTYSTTYDSTTKKVTIKS
jgi:Rieske Fe-S protein